MCLVSHELPEASTVDILKEAYRLLPYGGAIALMDMDPNSANFRKFASNPFAFAAFKSTEPWIKEYMEMDIENCMRSVGFEDIEIKSNSPRHRTIIAYKK